MSTGDDLQLNGDLACQNAEIRGELRVAGATITPGGGGLLTPIVNQDGAAFIPGQPISMVGLRATAAGPNFQVVGLVSVGAAPLGTAQLVPAGPLTLTTVQWDAVTGAVGGLTPGARYFVAPGPAGFITDISPTAPDTDKPVGFALDTTTMAVICSGDRPLEVNGNNIPFGTALEMNFSSDFALSAGGGGVVDVTLTAIRRTQLALLEWHSMVLAEATGDRVNFRNLASLNGTVYDNFTGADTFQPRGLGAAGTIADGINTGAVRSAPTMFITSAFAPGDSDITGAAAGFWTPGGSAPYLQFWNGQDGNGSSPAIGVANLNIRHENAGSLAANRFDLPGGVDIVLRYGEAIKFEYVAAVSRWRPAPTP